MTEGRDDTESMQGDTITADPRALAKELGPAADAPVGSCVGIASIALNMALKYHDINTVQDGALYQQYKLEGRNMRNLHIDAVFETAMKIEEHLVYANKRVTGFMLAMMAEMDAIADEEQKQKGVPAQEGTPETDADPGNPNEPKTGGDAPA